MGEPLRFCELVLLRDVGEPLHPLLSGNGVTSSNVECVSPAAKDLFPNLRVSTSYIMIVVPMARLGAASTRLSGCFALFGAASTRPIVVNILLSGCLRCFALRAASTRPIVINTCCRDACAACFALRAALVRAPFPKVDEAAGLASGGGSWTRARPGLVSAAGKSSPAGRLAELPEQAARPSA